MKTLCFAAWLASALAFACAACGYAPVHGAAGVERLAVALVESKVPDAVATDEVLAGVREELARAGALAPGGGYPRCEVEVVRLDEASEGIAAVPGADGRLVPESRAARVGIVARAWVRRAPGADPERDTGDVRVLETVEVAAEARAAGSRHSDALRSAGRRLGRRLAARLLGLPSPTEP